MTDHTSPGRLLGEFIKRFQNEQLDDATEVMPDGSTFHIFKKDGHTRYTMADASGELANEGSVYEKGSERPDDYPAQWPFFTNAKCSLVKLPDGKRIAWWGDESGSPILQRVIDEFYRLGWLIAENTEAMPMVTMVKLSRDAEHVTIMAMSLPTTTMVQIISE